jgi:hypothetical protein
MTVTLTGRELCEYAAKGLILEGKLPNHSGFDVQLDVKDGRLIAASFDVSKSEGE